MITILNKLNQPVTVNLKDGKSLHFLAKKSLPVTYEDMQCIELKEKLDRGILVILRIDN